MAKVIWTDNAADNLFEIQEYLTIRDRWAAARIGAELYVAGESLTDFPHRGRPAGGNARELVNVPPYVIRYRVVKEAVFILGIRHGRRRPLP